MEIELITSNGVNDAKICGKLRHKFIIEPVRRVWCFPTIEIRCKMMLKQGVPGGVKIFVEDSWSSITNPFEWSEEEGGRWVCNTKIDSANIDISDKPKTVEVEMLMYEFF